MLAITHCAGFVSGFALARLASDSWFFALSSAGHLAYGPLASTWDGGPQLRDLDDHVQDHVADLIVAVPPTLDEDDVRDELRRVPALVGASRLAWIDFVQPAASPGGMR